MSDDAIRVTALDLKTQETNSVDVPLDEYFLMCTGDCHVTSVQHYANGTAVVTIKGRKP